MNRKEIKKEAKERIKNNKFSLFWPIFLITMIELFTIIILIIPYIYAIQDKENTYNNIQLICILGLAIVSFVCLIFYLSYKNFILDFIKNKRFQYDKILECFRKNYSRFIISLFLILIISLFGLILIIPGIILFLGYQMTLYVLIDNDYDLGVISSMKESRHLMKKHRFNYLIFLLGFIGWILLSILTLGILNIWLIPYIEVSKCLYYIKLKELPIELDEKEKKN